VIVAVYRVTASHIQSPTGSLRASGEACHLTNASDYLDNNVSTTRRRGGVSTLTLVPLASQPKGGDSVVDFVAISAMVTKLVDLVRNVADSGDTLPKWVWNIVAFGIGIVAALLGDLNALGDLVKNIDATTAQVLTGLAIGGGASGFHELFDLLSSKATAAAESTPVAESG
jgi:hypothetical protein